MERNEAARILRRLSDGLDPVTERPVEGEDALSVLNRADTVRAMCTAVAALEQQQRRAARRGAHANQGTPWTEDEDRKLLTHFDGGRGLEELSTTHQRSRAGIRARLVKYGRLATLLAALALGVLMAPHDARAEPYAAVSLLDLTPELAAGYRWRHLEVEGAHFGELQHKENLNTITRVQDWTIRGDRLTLRGLLPVNDWLTLTASASYYRVSYKYTDSAGPSQEATGNSSGYGIGAQVSMGRRATLHIEAMQFKRASESLQLPQPGYFDLGDPEQLRIGLAWTF